MNRVKDPQITIAGWIKPAAIDPDREIVVVNLPPIVQLTTGRLMERTLIVNLPSDDYTGNTINCYLKYRLFDENAVNDQMSRVRNSHKNDPQTTLIGRIKFAHASTHKLIVVELPRRGVIEDTLRDEGVENTLIVNVPGDDHDEPELLCYLKYKAVDSHSDRRGGYDGERGRNPSSTV